MKRELPRRRGRFAVWLGILLVGVGVAHTLFWHWTEQQLRRGFDEWVAERREQGWRVQGGEPVTGGWPMSARLVVEKASLEGGKTVIPDGFAWRAERLILGVRLLYPRQLTILPEGEQHLRLSRMPDLPYTVDRLRIDIPLAPDALTYVADAAADNLRVEIPQGRGVAALNVGLLRLHADFRPSARRGEPALATSTSAEGIALPPRLPWALGGRISSASIDAVMSGPPPHSPSPLDEAKAWRDGGGKVDMRHLALGWGPLGVTASAEFRLDGQLQPTGTGTARFVGYSEALDGLAGGGAITARAAFAAKAVAALIASAPEGGGPPEVELPFILQDRTLSVQQIPLARVPAIPWPPA